MIRQVNGNNASVLHVRFEGQSCDLPLNELDLGARSSDRDVKQRLANYLNVPLQNFAHYKIDRHETGNMTVRPEAVFG